MGRIQGLGGGWGVAWGWGRGWGVEFGLCLCLGSGVWSWGWDQRQGEEVSATSREERSVITPMRTYARRAVTPKGTSMGATTMMRSTITRQRSTIWTALSTYSEICDGVRCVRE